MLNEFTGMRFGSLFSTVVSLMVSFKVPYDLGVLSVVLISGLESYNIVKIINLIR